MNLPLSPLTPRQSLGYIEIGQMLECIKDVTGEDSLFPLRGVVFEAGRSYRVRPFEITVKRTIKRPSHSGEVHEHSLSARDTAFGVMGDDGREFIFVDRRHCGDSKVTSAGIPVHPHFKLDTLLAKFRMPRPQTIAEANPAHLDYNLKFLDAFEEIVNSI